VDKTQQQLETFKFVTYLMNHLSLIGAREEMRSVVSGDLFSGTRGFVKGDENILAYVENNSARAQKFLEWVYVGNRVGSGVRMGLLDKKTILETWSPAWWIDLWKKLEPLIMEERKRRGIEKLYGDFEWFIKQLKKQLK
jgi:hypothetical protein